MRSSEQMGGELMKVTDVILTRDEKLKESENDPPRMEETGEDLSLEPGLRPGEPLDTAYGDPVDTCRPGGEML